MKTLKDHVILYDADCPLCKVYTSGFIKYKLLDNDGRTAFDQFDFGNHSHINKNLACDKIVLLDKNTREVTYGIDSLIKILAANFPWVKKIAGMHLIYAVLTVLYSFISFNRKMVAPGDASKTSSCVPSQNVGYRLLFIGLSGLLVHVIVTWYFNRFLGEHLSHSYDLPDIVLFFAQVCFQCLIFYVLKQQNYLDYAGQIAFVSVLGALGLLASGFGLNILSGFGLDVSFLSVVCYGAVFFFMFMEHLRRVHLYHWSAWLCVSWVIFRIIIYPLVFKY
ncbi:MAG TPA: hypothetical protein VF691_04360 [Cytophagaceae bacterium]|jgi:predicted DCC family thiol-disulfide oxidoreductase YuxK